MKTNTETESRICVLCHEAVPAYGRANRNGQRFMLLREAHAEQCKGTVSDDVAAEALVVADAFAASGGVESALTKYTADRSFRPLAFYRELARAIYEKKFPAQARVNEIAGEERARSPEQLRRHDLEAARGWLSLRKGIGTRYTCRYCRVEIVEAIGGDPANERVAEELADRHATLCALHVVGGLREPTLSAPRNPDPERPDFK